MDDEDATPPDGPPPWNPDPRVVEGYCRLHRPAVPDRYPVQPRGELAVRRPLVVATRAGARLLCGREHAGPCLWPDGDEAE